MTSSFDSATVVTHEVGADGVALRAGRSIPGKDPGGIVVTMLLGVAGALLAGLIGRAAGW